MSRDGSTRNAARSSRKGRQQRKPPGSLAHPDPSEHAAGPASSSPLPTKPPNRQVTFKPRTAKEREIKARIIELNNAYKTAWARMETLGDLAAETTYLIATAAYLAADLRLRMELPGYSCSPEEADQLLGWKRLAAPAWERYSRFCLDESRGAAHIRALTYARNIVDMLVANSEMLVEAVEDDAVVRSDEVRAHILEFERLDLQIFSLLFAEAADTQSAFAKIAVEAIRVDSKVPKHRGGLSVLMDSIMDPSAAHTIRPEQVVMPVVATINKERPSRLPDWVESAGTQPPQEFMTEKYGPLAPIGFVRGNRTELGWVAKMAIENPSRPIPWGKPKVARYLARFARNRTVWIRDFDGRMLDCYFRDREQFHRARSLMDQHRANAKEKGHKED